jgi:hypothetical protein
MAGFVICSCTESPVEGHISTLSERCGISKNDNRINITDEISPYRVDNRAFEALASD